LPVGSVPKVSRFLKGVFNKRPTVKVLLPSWRLDVVLSALQKYPFEPFGKASMRHRTLKCVFLAAITSARRCSEIQALGRAEPYLRMEKDGVRLRTVASFLPKTAIPGQLGNDVFLPSYKDKNKLLCVKRVVKGYLRATKDCDHKGYLFVAFGGKNCGSPVSKKTISNWLVQTVKEAYTLKGLNPPKVKAHSTRAMSTSWALFGKASMGDIMRAADWRCSRTFGKHYALDLWRSKDGGYGRTVLKTSVTAKN
jgi:hypothetical protein